jgi:hypothetical protein
VVSLVLFAYCTGERSSRGIERHCRQDIAYRVIAGNRVPDHATVARFIVRHEQRLGELFGLVLKLCAKGGLVASGVVAIDGTKLSASAASDSNVDYDRIARGIIGEAIKRDQAENEEHGDARGDEFPPELATEAGRRDWIVRELERERAGEGQAENEENDSQEQPDEDPLDGFDTERIVARVQGREGWTREARRQLDAQRSQTAGPISRSRQQRLRLAARWLEDDLAAEKRGNAAYEAFREHRRKHDPNVTDPDSRRMKGNRRYIQGYNAQAVVNEQQIVIAAEITADAGDFSHLRPMLTAALSELENAGIEDRPSVVVADAQYWNEQHMDDVTGEHGIPVLVPPDSGKRKDERPGWTGGRYAFMRRVLETDHGRETYRKRQTAIEPVFGHTKHNRKFTSFHRRGRAAVRTEWRLIMMSHNLTKLYRHQIAHLMA